MVTGLWAKALRYLFAVLTCSALACLAPFGLQAQSPYPGDTIVCFFNDHEVDAYVDPPEHFSQGAEALATFDFDFADNVPAEAQEAIRYAGAIWGSVLRSEVPIRVEVSWDSLEATALASAGPTTLYRDFEGSEAGRWYPVALAEAILGVPLNEADEPDIVVTANSEAMWYLGTDGQTPRILFDLVTVILHELGHGLGFLATASIDDMDRGSLGLGNFPVIFDIFLQDDEERTLVDTLEFANPSVELAEAFVGGRVFFGSPEASEVNAGEFPPLFSPVEFDEGSSLSHLDEFAFPGGDPNALMSPRLARGEAIHDPGPITLAIMEAIGWNVFTTAIITPVVVSRPLDAYPNPTAGEVVLRLPQPAPEDVPLFLVDALGHRMPLDVLPRQAAQLRLDLGRLPAGRYWIVGLAGEVVYRAQILVASR